MPQLETQTAPLRKRQLSVGIAAAELSITSIHSNDFTSLVKVAKVVDQIFAIVYRLLEKANRKITHSYLKLQKNTKNRERIIVVSKHQLVYLQTNSEKSTVLLNAHFDV